MKRNEKKKTGGQGEGGEKKGRKTKKSELPKFDICATEGYRIVSELLQKNDARNIVKMGAETDMLGMSLLSLAAGVGHRDGVISLITARVDINRKDAAGNYPLMQAVRGKFLDISEILLKAGADICLPNNNGDNSFMVGVLTGDAKVINTLWPFRGKLNINYGNKDGTTALHMATERRWEGCVDFLLLNGAMVNVQNKDGCTPLFISATAGDLKITERLVAKGADILIEDNDGMSALCRSVEAEKDDIVKFLLSKLTNAQRETFAKSRLERIRNLTKDENGHWETINEGNERFFEVLFTVFVDSSFKDTMFKIKAIPNLLTFCRQYIEEAEVISTMFIMCSMLMTDLGVGVDERFAVQFMRCQGQDLVLKVLKHNPLLDKIDSCSLSFDDEEAGMLVGMVLPLICLSGLEEGRDWLKKNLDNFNLIRMTDFLKSGKTLEDFFVCGKCPPIFQEVWTDYVKFYDDVMQEKTAINQAYLLQDEERDKQKAMKKRERKKMKRQKNKEAKEENVNKNANGKPGSDMETCREVGAEMAKKSEDNVRYDQHVLMPDWNVCIETATECDGNTIHTKRDPIHFRYSYVEPTICKKANGYHMPQAASPIKPIEQPQIAEWQTVEKKKVPAPKALNSRQLQVNQNASDSTKKQKRRSNKQKEPEQEINDVASNNPQTPPYVPTFWGKACWADIAKGVVHRTNQQQQSECVQQHSQPLQTTHPLQDELIRRQQDQLQMISHQEPPKQEKVVFTYDEEFPTLKEDFDKSSIGDTDVSEIRSTSTISYCGEGQIDQIPVPMTESDIMGKMPHHLSSHGNPVFHDQYHMQHHQQQQQHFMSPCQMMPMTQQNLLLNYGVSPDPPPPGFEVIQTQQMEHIRQHYPVQGVYPQNPVFHPPTVTMANIAQSLLQPYIIGNGNMQTDQGSSAVNEHSEPKQFSEEQRLEYLWGNSPMMSPQVSPMPHWSPHCQSPIPEPEIPVPKSNYVEQGLQPNYPPPGIVHPGNLGQFQAPCGPNNDFTTLMTNLAKCMSASKSESVLFPETLRSQDPSPTEKGPEEQELFPGFHDMESTVTLNPFLLESVAKEQVKRQYRTIAGKPVLENSAYFHDFDYYASLYGLSTEELKADAAESKLPETKFPQTDAGLEMPLLQTVEKLSQLMVNESAQDKEVQESQGGVATNMNDVLEVQKQTEEQQSAEWVAQSRRWKDKLNQIIDLPYNLKRQLGKIVIPVNSSEYRINKSGDAVVLGFLTDGSEVAVKEVDSGREVVNKELVTRLAASDTKYNFLLRYKALAEMGSTHYLATELCDYTLEEYISITRLDHTHDPLAANRLAWQLLKGVRYLHEDLGIVHGNLKPDNVYVDGDGKLRVGGYGFIKMDDYGQFKGRPGNCCWQATEMFAEDETSTLTASSDIQVVGMLLYYILTGGRHPYGSSSFEIELNLCQNSTTLTFVSEEANDLLTAMLFSDVNARPSIDVCLRHPFFWSEEKRFRMVLIAGSDVLKEMKTGVALTGTGSTTMTDFLNLSEYQHISDGWMSLVDGAVLKEMRAFRQYKNTLAEMVLFIYNSCLHFDKMSFAAREVLDDPCRYFLQRFPPLFMAVYRTIKASDRTDRSCYRPFF